MLQDKAIQRRHFRILILGGGTAGIMTAQYLRRAGQTGIAVMEPSRQHYYQPLWTLVGGGTVRREATVRPEARFIPAGVTWIQEAAVDIAPEANVVRTNSGAYTYDVLVVATGVELRWELLPGLAEAVARGHASSNYSYDTAPRTWEMIRNFRGGVALFHMPGTPIKCPGAPQKILYLAADYLRRQKRTGGAHLIFGSALNAIFGIQEYANVLNGVIERYGIETRFQIEMVEVDPERKEAIFRPRNQPDGPRTTIPYDILHAVPPQTAPAVIRKSALADPQRSQEGWIDVDRSTMQHLRYPNVFALGDVAGSPNAKTGAAAARQAPVVAQNLVALLAGKAPVAAYDGYIACPIVTGYGRMLLCEQDYTGGPRPRIKGIDTIRERYDMWLLKRYGLPWLYWHVLLKGRKPPFLGSTPTVAERAGASA